MANPNIENLYCISCGTTLEGRKKRLCGDPVCSKLEARRKSIEQVFAMTLDEYETILEHQEGKCALCKKPPKPGTTLAIDHDHEDGQSGRVNGLLDYRCNKFVKGNLTKEQIIALYEYVMNPPAVKALGREIYAPGRPKRKRQPRKRIRAGGSRRG